MVRKPPYVEEIRFSRSSLDSFIDEQRSSATPDSDRRATKLLDYPTVYVVHHETSERFSVYIGETTDIRSRTIQHLETDIGNREDWKALAASKASKMLVIGHPLFNKSLTLDIENRLMHYLSGVEAVEHLYNRRTNPQNKYYTDEYFDEVFTSIWRSLRKKNRRLFPTEEIIRDSALFKASPFHKLSREQLDGKRQIHQQILAALQTDQTGQLILVSGEAGAGKTVLLSSLFYELFQGQTRDDEPFEFQDLDAYVCVNHDEQLTVYKQIAKKLGLVRRKENRVLLPSQFINQHGEGSEVDVVLVDEAHLLWTRGTQGYSGRNQLADLLDRAKVVVAVFDPNQVLTGDQYWEESQREWMTTRAQIEIELENQMRINASPGTVEWIRNIVDERVIGNPELDNNRDDRGYEIRVFDSPEHLHQAIKTKANTESEVEKGLSRLVASYDWPYVSGRPPEEGGMWSVKIGPFELPWNYELGKKLDRPSKRELRGQAWAEQRHTIDEVGSTYTIQGFDLNYVGVIIGPSVKFRDGRVVFDPSENANRKVKNKRTLRDGSKVSVANQFLRNELNVLLTRGVNGLYIYAVDDELRKALQSAVRS